MQKEWIFLLVSICLLLAQTSYGQDRLCGSAKYTMLNFWLGDWMVYENGELVGTNTIEKILNGCAIVENWRDINGREGRSLFFVDLSSDNWKQVWVTDSGSMKEKTLQRVGNDGSVLFQGRVTLLDKKIVLDRTTLRPIRKPNGDFRVRQVIEQSEDEGKTWHVTFDAEYVSKDSQQPVPK